MRDRTYFHVTTRPHAPRRAWHADVEGLRNIALCSFTPRGIVDSSDRLPPSAHLCGNCGRIIAAQTDAR